MYKGIKTTVNKDYGMNIFSANIGDKIGVKSTPCANPSDFMGTVIEKVENRFGKHLVVKLQDGTTDTVHSFREVGLGWYYLGA